MCSGRGGRVRRANRRRPLQSRGSVVFLPREGHVAELLLRYGRSDDFEVPRSVWKWEVGVVPGDV